MKTFETNIMCASCIAKVTPVLDQIVGTGNWKVNTQDPKKILTVTVNAQSSETIREALAGAGYKAVEVRQD